MLNTVSPLIVVVVPLNCIEGHRSGYWHSSGYNLHLCDISTIDFFDDHITKIDVTAFYVQGGGGSTSTRNVNGTLFVSRQEHCP